MHRVGERPGTRLSQCTVRYDKLDLLRFETKEYGCNAKNDVDCTFNGLLWNFFPNISDMFYSTIGTNVWALRLQGGPGIQQYLSMDTDSAMCPCYMHMYAINPQRSMQLELGNSYTRQFNVKLVCHHDDKKECAPHL